MLLRLAVVLAATIALAPSRTRAEVAATGTFALDVIPGAPAATLDGTLTFDAGERTVLGQTVDLATSAGDMLFDGTAAIDPQAESAAFELAADAEATDVAFTVAGDAGCERAGCLGGRGTFAGELLVTAGTALPTGGVYTFEGTVVIDAQGSGADGTFAINAFPASTLGAGIDVTAGSGPQTFFDSVARVIRSFGALATFASVTGDGDTSFVGFSALPGALPAGIVLDPAVSVFVDVRTKAAVAGNVRLCLAYGDADVDGVVDGTSIEVSALRLLYAPSRRAAFRDVTATAASGTVCGTVPALGPFVLGVLAPAVPTTTTSTSTTLVPGAGTTTSVTVAPGVSTTSTTQPICATALDCLGIAIAGPLCPGETLNAKLATLALKRLVKAQELLLRSRSVATAKVAKLVRKARRQIDRLGTKADAFVRRPKGAISAACRDRIRTALGRVTLEIDANRI